MKLQRFRIEIIDGKTGDGRAGFAMAATLFALILLSLLGAAALSMSSGEKASAFAMLESSHSFYAAEAGINQIWGTWGDAMDSTVAAMSPGDTLDLGWQTLNSGSSYRGQVVRTDAGAEQPSYVLIVEGRGAGVNASERVLSVALVSGAGDGPFSLGKCCSAGATTRGLVKMKNDTHLSGVDTVPDSWDAERCSDFERKDVPGLVAYDSLDLNIYDDATITGDPPVVLDPTLNEDDFRVFDDVSLDSLNSMADTYLRNWDSSQRNLEFMDPAPSSCGTTQPITDDDCPVGPRYNADGTCDTTHPLNFGASSGPCKDHFPIVRVSGDWALGDNTGGYAQGLFIMDTSTTADLSARTTETGVGSEFDIEGFYPWEVAGIVVGRGCFEMDTPDGGGIHRWFGAAFSDGFIKPNLNCSGDEPFYMHSNTEFRYSQCVVQNVLKFSGAGQSEGAAHGLIPSRALREILR